jgi:hypothetical protein
MREYFPAIQDSLKQQLDTSYLRKKIVRPVKKV